MKLYDIEVSRYRESVENTKDFMYLGSMVSFTISLDSGSYRMTVGVMNFTQKYIERVEKRNPGSSAKSYVLFPQEEEWMPDDLYDHVSIASYYFKDTVLSCVHNNAHKQMKISLKDKVLDVIYRFKRPFLMHINPQ